jgi:tRNA/tmRNA/rRNA uracil-C5-methylase (TrmA/RlmC/RlmD family)
VEQDPRAVRAGRAAADAAGVTVRLRHADVAREASSLARRGERFDLVVLDPPRAGAGRVIDDIAALAQRAVAYVSCDPVTLARDLRRLTGHGFVLDSVRAYDMFPHTHHVETVAWATRPA